MKNIWKLFLLGMMVLVLAACTDDDSVEEEAAEGTDSDDQTETAAGGDLTIAIPSDAVSMDPHGSNDVPSEQVRDEIYEGLVTQDENLEIVPLLSLIHI